MRRIANGKDRWILFQPSSEPCTQVRGRSTCQVPSASRASRHGHRAGSAPAEQRHSRESGNPGRTFARTRRGTGTPDWTVRLAERCPASCSASDRAYVDRSLSSRGQYGDWRSRIAARSQGRLSWFDRLSTIGNGHFPGERSDQPGRNLGRATSSCFSQSTTTSMPTRISSSAMPTRFVLRRGPSSSSTVARL